MASGPTDVAILRARPDPLPAWKWRSDTVTPFGLPYHYVEGLDLPWNNVEAGTKIPRGSGYQYYPGTHDISAFSIVFYEDNKVSTMKWLNAWKGKVKDFNTGLYGYPKDYKKDWTFFLCDQKDAIKMRIKLIGIWPADTQSLNLGYNDEGRLTVSQQFSIDDQDIAFA